MKKLSLLLLLSAFIFSACSNDDEIDAVASFEKMLTQAETEYSTENGTAYNETYQHSTFKDQLNLLEFDHYYGSWGFGGGFIYTNKTDKTTLNDTNNSAITGTGKLGKVYLTSYFNSFTPSRITNLDSDKYTFKGLWVTNSTYAYLAIQDGYNGAKKFVDGDWFKLTAIGYSSSNQSLGSIDFYLADFRDGKEININTWQWMDLSSISSAAYIMFELTSSDNSTYGDATYMNTPSYFCLDGITLTER